MRGDGVLAAFLPFSVVVQAAPKTPRSWGFVDQIGTGPEPTGALFLGLTSLCAREPQRLSGVVEDVRTRRVTVMFSKP